MKKILPYFLIIVLTSGLMAQKNDTIVIPKQARKNFLFAELGGATVVGINYECIFYNNRKLTYLFRSGIGMNMNFRVRNILVTGITSQYKINKKWFTELGVYPQLWLTYNPNPATRAARDSAKQDFKALGTPYMPPILYTNTLHLGFKYNITDRFFIKMAYTPFLSFYSSSNKTIKTYYNNYASFCFGFSF